MKKTLILLCTFIIAGELEVNGDLKVLGDIESTTIDSLLNKILILQQQLDNPSFMGYKNIEV